MEEGSLLIPLLTVLGLILISAFFSGSETGLTSVANAKIYKLKMAGNRRAIILSKLREDKERLIGAILLGNNIVNIAASAIATALAIKLFGETGVVYATVLMTVLVLIFAEVLPKTYAVRHAEKVALSVAPVFVLITKILAPFTMAVHVIVNFTLNLLTTAPQDNMSGTEILRGAIEMYHEEGGVEENDRNMLSGIIDLEAVDVEKIMIHRNDMSTTSIDQPFSKIAAFVANSNHSRIPLWQGSPDKIVGVLHAKDLFKVTQNQQGDLDDLDIKSVVREPWYVPETTTLKNQLQAFRSHRRHFALVVDESGGLSGLVTLTDILEEVVGDIEDEHDKPEDHPIRKTADGAYEVEGAISIRDLNKALGWNFPLNETSTLAGLVMQLAQRIPDEGDIFEMDNFMFQVLGKNGTQLTRIKIRQTISADEESDVPPQQPESKEE
ncbi:MAG: DUF21 domain-containing protein [Rhodospirillales bacterium]|nr:DUF21 domain-containing protein [Rhodospirillales bacterium]